MSTLNHRKEVNVRIFKLNYFSISYVAQKKPSRTAKTLFCNIRKFRNHMAYGEKSLINNKINSLKNLSVVKIFRTSNIFEMNSITMRYGNPQLINEFTVYLGDSNNEFISLFEDQHFD